MNQARRNARLPRCTACAQDGFYDRTMRARVAVVRVELSREPYVARLCEFHLAQLQQSGPPGSVQVTERYQAPD